MQSKTQIACYYFPQYHPDPRNDASHGPGWTEWDEVRAAAPRFPGHAQPKQPLWGYEDDSLPEVAARKIDAAADHGIDTLIFDWYWQEDGPFLEAALERGFLRAPNSGRLSYALMWAVHWPVSRAAFDAAADHMIRHYLAHPAYWAIGGAPYISFFEIATLVRGLGGVESARVALAALRRRATAETGRDLHLNAVLLNAGRMGPAHESVEAQNALLSSLGFDSATTYNWTDWTPLDTFPTVPYAPYAASAVRQWERASRLYALPYYPNVMVGWDPSPRTAQDRPFARGDYPYTPILVGNTPAAFEGILRQARDFLATRPPRERILTIYAWNEWAEGGYLEPDTLHGMGYLEAIRRVFGAGGT